MPCCARAAGTDPTVPYSHPQQCYLEDHSATAMSHRPHLLVNNIEIPPHPWRKLEKSVWKSSIFPGNLEIFLPECPEEYNLILIEKNPYPTIVGNHKIVMEIKTKKKKKLNLRAGVCCKWMHWSSPICVWRHIHCSCYLLCSWPRMQPCCWGTRCGFGQDSNDSGSVRGGCLLIEQALSIPKSSDLPKVGCQNRQVQGPGPTEMNQ